MILISGGAYKCCCDVDLLKRWRQAFADLGCQTVTLVYRTPRPKDLPIYQSAWEDAQRAVRIVRRESARYGFSPEKIGVIGMSAGGHLATLLATSALTPAYAPVDDIDNLPCHINWAIVHAPAYNTVNGETGEKTPNDGISLDPKISGVFAFDKKTCPISFHHGGADVYSPNGSTLCYRELRKRGIPAELHLYADSPHGSYGLECAVEFMNQMEFVGKLRTSREIGLRIYPHHTEETRKEMLWPNDQIPDLSQNQKYEPYLVWFFPVKKKTRAVQLIFPGGGYNLVNFMGEGAPIAMDFNARGMTAAVVMYRCPRPKGAGKHQSGLQDAQRAIRLVRSQAAGLGLDPQRIGLMGFSAGGHLALLASTTSSKQSYDPVDEIDAISADVQWVIPFYPAYVLTDGAEKPNALGGNDDCAEIVPELEFSADTPPMCFLHGDSDIWSAMNSVKCWERLRRYGVQSDLHTYARRGHCFHIQASPDTGSWNCLERVWNFLPRKGFVE